MLREELFINNKSVKVCNGRSITHSKGNPALKSVFFIGLLSFFLLFVSSMAGAVDINVTLISPPDNTTLSVSTFTLNYSVNVQSNCTVFLWNSTGLQDLYHMVANGSAAYLVNDTDDGPYQWNVKCSNGTNIGWGDSTKNWTFSVSTAPLVQVAKELINSGPAIPIGDKAQFRVIITNTDSYNLTSVWLRDEFDANINFTNESSCPAVNFSSHGGAGSYVNINITDCLGSPMVPGSNFTVLLNFTVVGSSNNANNTAVVDVFDSNGDDDESMDTTFFATGEQSPPVFNAGLATRRSSVTPAFIMQNSWNLLNFSVFRRASPSSCLRNITIFIPDSNFTFNGYNASSIDPSNYTFYADGLALIWKATGNDFFCGEGPENFIVNISSSSPLGSSTFIVMGYADDNTSSSMNMTIFTTFPFSYSGQVKYSSVGLPGATASLTVSSHGMGSDVSLGTFSALTDPNGFFNITDIPGMNVSLGGPSPGNNSDMLFYQLSVTKYNTSLQRYAMYIGPSLPDLPEMNLRSDMGLGNPEVNLKPAVTFHVLVEGYDYKAGPLNDSLCNESGCPYDDFNWTNLIFSYSLKDKKLGFPVSYSFSSTSSEAYISAPLSRNYSLMLFPESSFPIYVNFEDIAANCSTAGVDISRTGVNATCTITNGTYLINAIVTADMNITPLTGFINESGGPFDSVRVVAYMLGAGEMMSDQDVLPFDMGNMMRMPPNPAYNDYYNASSGYYRIYLPATQAHSDIMLVAYASKGGVYYSDKYKLTSSGKSFSVPSYNFSLSKLISGSTSSISSNDVSADWNSTTVINTTSVTFNLMSNNSLLENENAFVEIKMSDAGFEYRKVTTAQSGQFSLPLIEGEGIDKLNVYSQSYAPLSLSVSSAVLTGSASSQYIHCSSGVCNVSLSSFKPFDPDNPQHTLPVQIDFYKSNSSCDVPNPPPACNLMAGMNMSNFSPFKAILKGDVSLRITSGNISVHYVNTDLLASGPPDAAFSSNASGSGMEAAWKFGSKGPEIYNRVYFAVPYSSELSNTTITVRIPYLYDTDFNVIWNSSAGDTINNLTGTDYEDYLNSSYEAYLNGTGVVCLGNNSDFSNGPCFKDSANMKVWMEIPHFSGVGTVISGAGTLENASLLIWDETDSNEPYANQTREAGDSVLFFANYSVEQSGAPINDSLGDCFISFVSGGPFGMSWNASINLWEYNRSFYSAGVYSWNVTCNSSTYTEMLANDTVNISDATAPAVTYNTTNVSSVIVGGSVFINTNWTETNINSGNMSMTLYVNGAAVSSKNSSGLWANFSYTTTSSDYPTVVFMVSATDSYGNTGYSANMSVSVNLSCGMSVTGNLTLESDLNCSSSASALQVSSNDIIIDCAGHSLIGGLDNSSGVLINGYTGVILRSCTIQGFDNGVYANNSNGSTFTNLTITGSADYGIYLMGSSNVISHTTLEHQGQAGVLISGSSADNNLTDNYFYNNTIAVDINSDSDNNIFNNNISSSSSLGMNITTGSVYWLITSRNRIVDNNLTVSGTINITGSGVLELINSYLTLNGVLFDRTGNITTLESESSNLTANTATDVSFDNVDTNLTVVLSANVSATFLVSPVTPNSTPGSLTTLKAVSVDVPAAVEGNLSWVIIRIFYNASELAAANIDESTLKIYYYNESSSSWQLEPHQGVDTTNDYVWANVTHLSTYGAFGSAPATSSSSGGSSSSGAYTNTIILSENATTVKLMDGEGVRMNFEDRYYTLTLSSFNASSADFIITSYYTTNQEFSVSKDSGRNINLNNDPYYDLEVEVPDISGGSILVSLRKIHTTSIYKGKNKSKAVPAPAPQPSEVAPTGNAVSGEAKTTPKKETTTEEATGEAKKEENPQNAAAPEEKEKNKAAENTKEKEEQPPMKKSFMEGKETLIFIVLAAVVLLIALFAVLRAKRSY